MKLLSPKEVTDRKQAEVIKNVARTELVQEALNSKIKELEEAEARFNLALAGQRIRWSQEEEAALQKINELRGEIVALEKKKKELLVPIEEREKKSYALFIEAEKALDVARQNVQDTEKLKTEQELVADTLQDRLDNVSLREADLDLREKKLVVRELAVEEERGNIRKLSSELSIKLQNL